MIDDSAETAPDPATAFRRMHDARDGFLMPNAWDAGSAVILAEAGFPAIATTSAGVAFSLGKGDHTLPSGAAPVTREETLDRARQIAAAVPVPVNGDLEGGYGPRPEDVALTVRLAVEAGLAGGNIEDYDNGELYDEELAVERVAAAREVIDATGGEFVLTARTDVLVVRPGALDEAITRANRFREAGADCLFAPGVNDPRLIATFTREVDGPVNQVMGLGDTSLTVSALRAAGVARISVGGSIARAALGFVRRAARELRDHGTLVYAESQIPQGELNSLFAARRTGALPFRSDRA